MDGTAMAEGRFEFSRMRKLLAVEWLVRELGVEADRAEMIAKKVSRGHDEHGGHVGDVGPARALEIVDLVGYSACRLAEEGELAADELELLAMVMLLWDKHAAVEAARLSRSRAAEGGERNAAAQ